MVANVDQVVIVFAIKKPDIDMSLLQKFLVYNEHIGLKVVVCLNKIDLDQYNEAEPIIKMLSSVPYEYICTSALDKIGIDELKEKLTGVYRYLQDLQVSANLRYLMLSIRAYI